MNPRIRTDAATAAPKFSGSPHGALLAGEFRA